MHSRFSVTGLLRNLIKSDAMRAILGLCLAIVLLLSPVFFQGKVLVPGDLSNNDPFFLQDTIKTPAPPQNPLLGDQIVQFYVWHRLAASSFASDGHAPLWNPYIFTGQPLVANAQSALFYPPNMMLRLLSAGKVANIRGIFNLLFAGIFTYLFLRKLGISATGAFIASISFSFSGPVIVWLGHPHVNVLVCLPFMMWAGENLLNKLSGFWILVLGGGMGVSILAGHPETEFHIWFVFSVFFLVRLATIDDELKHRGRLLVAFIAAASFGCVIGGIQLVPFLDFMLQSSTFAQRSQSMGVEFYSPAWLANLATIVSLVCPNIFGNPIDNNYIWPFSIFQNYSEQTVYFGTIPLALASGAMFANRMKRPFIIMSFLAVFCIGVALRLPLLEAFNHLPVFKMALNKRLKLPFVFLAAGMAGYGYDILCSHLKSVQQQSRSFYISRGVVLSSILFYLVIIVYKICFSADVQHGTFQYGLLTTIFSYSQWKTYVPFFTSLVVGSCYLIFIRCRNCFNWFQGALIALTMIELLVLAWGYNPMVNEADILPKLNAVEFIKNRETQPFRILTTDELFWPNYGAVYGIADVAGYDLPVYKRYSDLYLALGGQDDYIQVWDPSWPVIDFLNVKYVITKNQIQHDKFKLVYFSLGNYRIYENLNAYPRAFMVYGSEVIKNDAILLKNMVSGKQDFSNKVFLDDPMQPPVENHPEVPPHNNVTVTKYSSDNVTVEVDTTKSGILVVSDLYTPDWVSRLDNQIVKLYRANYTYRAVYVPGGRHTITFQYSPFSYKIGAAMTIAGMAVILLFGLKAMLCRFLFLLK